MDTRAILTQVPLFKNMNPEYLERIERVAVERTFKPGQTILSEGEMGIAFYVVASGNVEVARGDGPVVNRIGPGGSFGEMALLNDLPRMATVKAVGDVSCLVLPRLDFLDALRDQPEIAIQLLKTLAELLRRAEERADQAQSATQR
jgi:CRP-like cAMP-binding protein